MLTNDQELAMTQQCTHQFQTLLLHRKEGAENNFGVSSWGKFVSPDGRRVAQMMLAALHQAHKVWGVPCRYGFALACYSGLQVW